MKNLFAGVVQAFSNWSGTGFCGECKDSPCPPAVAYEKQSSYHLGSLTPQVLANWRNN